MTRSMRWSENAEVIDEDAESNVGTSPRRVVIGAKRMTAGRQPKYQFESKSAKKKKKKEGPLCI